MDMKINTKAETEGFDEATEKVENLVDAIDCFPAQVTIENCHDCTFNIYPSQVSTITK